MDEFDLDQPWRLRESVSLRPERFGALAYDFTTRRLSFLRSRRLLALVEALEDHPSARAACESTGVRADELAGYRKALTALASSGMISRRREPE